MPRPVFGNTLGTSWSNPSQWKYFGFPEPKDATQRDWLKTNVFNPAATLGIKSCPYWQAPNISGGVPEWGYYKYNWSNYSIPNDSSTDILAFGNYPLFNACSNSGTWRDFIVYTLNQNMTDLGVTGWYQDGYIVNGCRNTDHGCGYVDDTGRVCPTYPIFATRELMKRMYVAIKGINPNAKIVGHMSGFLQIPVLSFADAYLDGENVPTPYYWVKGVQPLAFDGYYSNRLPNDVVQAEYAGRQWGVVPIFLVQLSRNVGESDASYIARTKDMMATMFVNDIPTIWAMMCDQPTIYNYWRALDSFGMSAMESLPYWMNSAYVTSSSSDIKITVYRKTGKVMFIVANLSNNDVTETMTMNPTNLGIDGASKFLSDRISGESFVVDSNNSINFSMPRKSLRLIEWQQIEGVTVNTTASDGSVTAWKFNGAGWTPWSANIGGEARRLVLADPMNNGHNDAYVAGANGLYRVFADGGSINAQALYTAKGTWSVASGDVDGNGKLDIVVGGDSPVLKYEYNNGWQKTDIIADTYEANKGVTAGNTHNSISNEIGVFCSTSGAGTTIGAQYNGTGYSQIADWLGGNWSHAKGGVDLYGDGTRLSVATKARYVGVLDFTGSYPAVREWIAVDGGMNYYTCAIGDSKNDGKVSVVVGADGGSGWQFLLNYERVGSAWNQSSVYEYHAGKVTGIDIADCDGDGKNEVIAVNDAGIIRVFRWNGTQFSLISSLQTLQSFTDVAVGDIAGTSPDPEVINISASKNKADKAQVQVSGIITAVLADCFYIESQDRANGIRVYSHSITPQSGYLATVIGTMSTLASGERCIDSYSMQQVPGLLIAPLGATNKSLGGGAFGLQQGVTGGIGLNNIGLLLKTTGSVTQTDNGWFMITDGSGAAIKVLGDLNPSVGYVAVTGVLSCEKVGTNIAPVIMATDITLL
ncbi:MAG: FG-GAP repeat domain-containing protein [Armatimonadota bacterium]